MNIFPVLEQGLKAIESFYESWNTKRFAELISVGFTSVILMNEAAKKEFENTLTYYTRLADDSRYKLLEEELKEVISEIGKEMSKVHCFEAAERDFERNSFRKTLSSPFTVNQGADLSFSEFNTLCFKPRNYWKLGEGAPHIFYMEPELPIQQCVGHILDQYKAFDEFIGWIIKPFYELAGKTAEKNMDSLLARYRKKLKELRAMLISEAKKLHFPAYHELAELMKRFDEQDLEFFHAIYGNEKGLEKWKGHVREVYNDLFLKTKGKLEEGNSGAELYLWDNTTDTLLDDDVVLRKQQKKEGTHFALLTGKLEEGAFSTKVSMKPGIANALLHLYGLRKKGIKSIEPATLAEALRVKIGTLNTQRSTLKKSLRELGQEELIFTNPKNEWILNPNLSCMKDLSGER